MIDILTSVLGIGDYAELRARAVPMAIQGRVLPVISIEDLIVAKEAVGRDKDLLTVKELRAIMAMRAQKRDESV